MHSQKKMAKMNAASMHAHCTVFSIHWESNQLYRTNIISYRNNDSVDKKTN